MASWRPRTVATPRAGVSHARAAARATAAAAVAITLAMVAIPTSPAEAFVNPPAAFPPPSAAWQRGRATAPASSLTPQAALASALFSGPGCPIAAAASERECAGARLRFTAGRERRHERFSSGLGSPLRSSPGGDSGTPESGDSGDEDPSDPVGDGPAGMPDNSQELREKLETIAANTPPPVVEGVAGGLTKEEQEALEALEEDRRDQEEMERREAAMQAKSLNLYAYSDEDDEEDPDAEKYEEIIANMTKPLGITIEESTDRAKLVYITSVGEKAEAAGLQVGDVLTGASAVFGDAVWSVKEKSIAEIRSLVGCRTEPYSLLRVERGHVSLEERCAPGFDDDDLDNCWRLPDDMLGDTPEECELNPNYAKMWAAVYEDELEVLKGGSAARAAGVGGQPKKGNQGPPPKDKPGPGSFNGETLTGDSWDTSGTF